MKEGSRQKTGERGHIRPLKLAPPTATSEDKFLGADRLGLFCIILLIISYVIFSRFSISVAVCAAGGRYGEPNVLLSPVSPIRDFFRQDEVYKKVPNEGSTKQIGQNNCMG